MPDVSDDILMVRCKGRDTDAFRMLVDRYKRQAYGFAFSYVRNSEDALNLSQDAFVRAWNSIGTFEDGRPFAPWLFSIVKHLALNLIDHKRRLREISLDQAMEDSGYDLPDDDADPLERMEQDETKRRVWRAIMGLKEEFREIIVLKHFNDLSYREIADALDIPIGTVMSRLFNARRALMEMLGDAGGEEEP